MTFNFSPFSYFLWSISRPGKTGSYDLSGDSDANVPSGKFTPTELLYERVITKLFKQYEIPIHITDPIRLAIRSKLWRMGKVLSKLGGGQRKKQLDKWKDGPNSSWNFEVSESEVKWQLLKRKHSVETQLEVECTKRRKLERSSKTGENKNSNQEL